jgi:hypothetical protein
MLEWGGCGNILLYFKYVWINLRSTHFPLYTHAIDKEKSKKTAGFPFALSRRPRGDLKLCRISFSSIEHLGNKSST